jgi:uncharacterized protein
VRDNLVFNLESWPEAGVSIDFILSPPALLSAMKSGLWETEPQVEEAADLLVFKSSMRGHLDIQLASRVLKIKGAFSIKVQVSCTRCLTPFVGRIRDNISEIVKLVDPGGDANVKAAVDGDLIVTNNQFDLAPLMAELFWLAWPTKPLCKPDCAGLCPSCGANLNDGECSCRRDNVTKH